MGFDIGGAMSGASSGMALGPWGAVAGGVLGGLFGGTPEPEYYDADDYGRDMAPYQGMVDFQVNQANMLQDPNSWLNRQQNRQIINNSMDQMGVSNIMNQRNNASNPYANTSGLNAQQNKASLLQYANTGLQQGRQNFQQNFGQGISQFQNAMQHQGDISTGLANLNAANVGTANEWQMEKADNFSSGLGGLFGGIGSFGDIGANGGLTSNNAFSNFMGSF